MRKRVPIVALVCAAALTFVAVAPASADSVSGSTSCASPKQLKVSGTTYGGAGYLKVINVGTYNFSYDGPKSWIFPTRSGTWVVSGPIVTAGSGSCVS